MSRRFSLREFQQNVLDRLQARVAGSGEQASALGVMIGEQRWVVEMSDISEVIPLPTMTEVPLVKPWYCGVANVRGNLIGIVDLAAYMGGAATSRENQSRVMLLGQKYALNAGLLVSRVLGLRNIATWTQNEQNGEIRLQDEQGLVWRKLDMVSLLQQPEFMQIGL